MKQSEKRRASNAAYRERNRARIRERQRGEHAAHYARRKARAAEQHSSYAGLREVERRRAGQLPKDARNKIRKAKTQQRRAAERASALVKREAKRKPWFGLPPAERLRMRYRLDPDYRRASILKAFVRKKRTRAAADGSVTPARLRDLWARTTVCYLCKRRLSEKTKSFDHCVAITDGGAHSMSNLAVVHLKCNLAKSAKRMVIV